jgi:hypothetical protein
MQQSLFGSRGRSGVHISSCEAQFSQSPLLDSGENIHLSLLAVPGMSPPIGTLP